MLKVLAILFSVITALSSRAAQPSYNSRLSQSSEFNLESSITDYDYEEFNRHERVHEEGKKPIEQYLQSVFDHIEQHLDFTMKRIFEDVNNHIHHMAIELSDISAQERFEREQSRSSKTQIEEPIKDDYKPVQESTQSSVQNSEPKGATFAGEDSMEIPMNFNNEEIEQNNLNEGETGTAIETQ